MDVAAWLRGLGLEQYEPAFRDNGVDARVLPKLTADDLKDLGVTMVGHRRIILDAIATLREPTSPTGSAEPAPAEPIPERPEATTGGQAERRQLTVCSAISSARPRFLGVSIPRICAR